MDPDEPFAYRPGVHFERDDAAFTSASGEVDPLVEDLLDITGAAFIEDRNHSRGEPGTPAWRRSLHVPVQVRWPWFWQRPAVQDVLLRLLHWSTDDDWELMFQQSAAVQPPRPLRLDLEKREREVVLFSGGLDSTAGTALLAAAGTPVLGVAVCTNSSMRSYQASTLKALRDIEGADVDVRYATFHRKGRASREDPTRRTRGLVFLVHGWAVARSVGRRRLLVLENGVGALNLPLTVAQSGVMTSRSVHPRTLQLAAQLFSLIDDAPFSVENPHLRETKGQMCARLPQTAKEACTASQSCDSAASGRSALARRCGRCSSCLLRRISLESCGRADWDRGAYRSEATDGVSGAFRGLLYQAAQMATALRQTDPVAALRTAFPALADVPRKSLSDDDLVRLCRAHVAECSRYPHPLVHSFLTADGLAA